MRKNKQPTPTVEHRFTPTTEGGRFEVRREGEGMPTLVGYAAVFNSRTQLGWFDEEIAPGAFAQSLADGDDVRALFNHDTARVIGRRGAGTLRIEEDATGLRVEIDLPDTTTARDLVASIERGDIDGMSFGFRAREQEWIEREDESELRRLIDVELIEVSPVTFPAYADTSIAQRSYEAARSGTGDPRNSQAGTNASEESNHHKPKPSAALQLRRASRR